MDSEHIDTILFEDDIKAAFGWTRDRLNELVGDENAMAFAFVDNRSRIVVPAMGISELLARAAGAVGDQRNLLLDMAQSYVLQKFRLGTRMDETDAKLPELNDKEWLFDWAIRHATSAGKPTAGHALTGALRRDRDTEKEQPNGTKSLFAFSARLTGDDRETKLRSYVPRLGVLTPPEANLLDHFGFLFLPNTFSRRLHLLAIFTGSGMERFNPSTDEGVAALNDIKHYAGLLMRVLQSNLTSSSPRHLARSLNINWSKAVLNTLVEAPPQNPYMAAVAAEFLRACLDHRSHDVPPRHLIRFAWERSQTTAEQAGNPAFIETIRKHLPKRYADECPEKLHYRLDWVINYFDDVTQGRLLQDNLEPHENARVFVVASPRGGVGKSTIAHLTATVLARAVRERKKTTGKKGVCLLELDFTSPTFFLLNDRLREELRARALEKFGIPRMVPNPLLRIIHSFYEWLSKPSTLERNPDEWNVGQEIDAWCVKDEDEDIHYLIPSPGIHHSNAAGAMTKPPDENESRYLLFKKWRLSGELSGKEHDTLIVDRLLGSLLERFDHVVVDTSAGFTDFTAAAASSPKMDVLLMVSDATKTSLISTLDHLNYPQRENVASHAAAKRYLVINRCRKLDDNLFGGRNEIFDHCKHWSNNNGAGTLAGRDLKAIEDMLFRQCSGVVRVPWLDTWARVESSEQWDTLAEDHDLEDFQNLIFGCASST